MTFASNTIDRFRTSPLVPVYAYVSCLRSVVVRYSVMRRTSKVFLSPSKRAILVHISRQPQTVNIKAIYLSVPPFKVESCPSLI
jgi:hypothetical protein